MKKEFKIFKIGFLYGDPRVYELKNKYACA